MGGEGSLSIVGGVVIWRGRGGRGSPPIAVGSSPLAGAGSRPIARRVAAI